MSQLDCSVFDSLMLKQTSNQLENIFLSDNQETFHAYQTSCLQSALSAKNILLSRKLARYLLADSGEIDIKKVVAAIDYLSSHLYPLGPQRHNEAKSREHILNMLRIIKKEAFIGESLKKLFAPSYTSIQTLILSTLGLPLDTTVTALHARQAVLTSLFTYLNQDAGSCFSSAFAHLIHQEYPLLFIKDLCELLTSGRITRTVGSREVFAPINLFHGIGELFKPVKIVDIYPNPIEKLSQSPGLQQAFIAAGLLKDPRDLSQLLSHSYILQATQDIENTISAHEILFYTLLHHYQLSSHALTQQLTRYGSLSLSQKEEAVSQFLHAYEQAKAAFFNDTQNPLLKAWEYTLANLSDVNGESTLHHLRIALGWEESDTTSLAYIMKSYVTEQLNQSLTLAKQYEQSYQQTREKIELLEKSIQSSQSPSVIEEQALLHKKLNQTLHDWNFAQEKAKKLLNLPNFLLSFYNKVLPQYFHGSYDVSVQKHTYHYEDTPAYFRMLFTHGRSHPHAWVPIYSLQDFTTLLAKFFADTKEELLEKHAIIGLEKETSILVDHIIAFIHKESSQLAFLTRILQSYGQPIPAGILNNLDSLDYLPWLYIAKGNLDSLIQNYFEHLEEISHIQKLPENAHELAAFFSDALKDMPTIIKRFLEDNQHQLLVASPKHTFSITAGSPLFREAWDNNWYSYTWLRDVWLKKHQAFLSTITLDERCIRKFLNDFCSKYHLKIDPTSLHCDADIALSIPDFYSAISTALNQFSQSKPNLTILYQRYLAHQIVQEIPYVSAQQLPEILQHLSSHMGISKLSYEQHKDLILQYVAQGDLLSSSELFHLVMGLLMQSYQQVYVEEDLFLRLISSMRHYQLAYPAPLLFGDSQWAYNYFGFILHPGAQQIDLWEFNYAGLQGLPLDPLQSFSLFDETKPWVLYSNPIEYGMPPSPGSRTKMPKEFFS